MKQLEIECPEGHEIDQKKSDLIKGIIKFKKIKEKKWKLDYMDIVDELLSDTGYYITQHGQISYTNFKHMSSSTKLELNNALDRKQLESLLTLNKLINVAKYLNGDWLPDFEAGDEIKYYPSLTRSRLNIGTAYIVHGSDVYFKSKELVEQAIEILGEKEIRKALTLQY